jgi:hypothetical protein
MLSFKEYIQESEMLFEITVQDMTNATTRYRGYPKGIYPQAPKVEVTKIVPAIGVKTISFYGEVPSFTREGTAKYTQALMFKDVQFAAEPKEGEEDAWKYIDMPNIKIWMKLPSLEDNHSLVSCSCPDFRFRASVALKKNSALLGRLIPYQKKTNRPPLNPDDEPIMCKHTFNFLRGLTANGWVKG